jgi:hypothetical protein
MAASIFTCHAGLCFLPDLLKCSASPPYLTNNQIINIQIGMLIASPNMILLAVSSSLLSSLSTGFQSQHPVIDPYSSYIGQQGRSLQVMQLSI